MKMSMNAPHCFCIFLLMTVIYFLLCLSWGSLLDYIKMHNVTLHKTLQYWQFFRGTGKSDYRPLAVKANQQMTDTNVFHRISQTWLSLICVAGDVNLRYLMDIDLMFLLVENHISLYTYMQILYHISPNFPFKGTISEVWQKDLITRITLFRAAGCNELE